MSMMDLLKPTTAGPTGSVVRAITRANIKAIKIKEDSKEIAKAEAKVIEAVLVIVKTVARRKELEKVAPSAVLTRHTLDTLLAKIRAATLDIHRK